MSIAPLPAKGVTDWYTWAQDVDSASRAVDAGNTATTTANITDATPVGRNVLKAADAAAARTAIGAGTSNLALGGTSTTAAAGNHTHTAATTSTAGTMSAADKTKLDGVATGATAFTAANAVTAVGGKLWFGTQAQYDALGTKDAATLYAITG